MFSALLHRRFEKTAQQVQRRLTSSNKYLKVKLQELFTKVSYWYIYVYTHQIDHSYVAIFLAIYAEIIYATITRTS